MYGSTDFTWTSQISSTFESSKIHQNTQKQKASLRMPFAFVQRRELDLRAPKPWKVFNMEKFTTTQI